MDDSISLVSVHMSKIDQ